MMIYFSKAVCGKISQNKSKTTPTSIVVSDENQSIDINVGDDLVLLFQDVLVDGQVTEVTDEGEITLNDIPIIINKANFIGIK